jgi:hypothetical protein
LELYLSFYKRSTWGIPGVEYLLSHCKATSKKGLDEAEVHSGVSLSNDTAMSVAIGKSCRCFQKH